MFLSDAFAILTILAGSLSVVSASAGDIRSREIASSRQLDSAECLKNYDTLRLEFSKLVRQDNRVDRNEVCKVVDGRLIVSTPKENCGERKSEVDCIPRTCSIGDYKDITENTGEPTGCKVDMALLPYDVIQCDYDNVKISTEIEKLVTDGMKDLGKMCDKVHGRIFEETYTGDCGVFRNATECQAQSCFPITNEVARAFEKRIPSSCNVYLSSHSSGVSYLETKSIIAALLVPLLVNLLNW